MLCSYRSLFWSLFCQAKLHFDSPAAGLNNLRERVLNIHQHLTTKWRILNQWWRCKQDQSQLESAQINVPVELNLVEFILTFTPEYNWREFCSQEDVFAFWHVVEIPWDCDGFLPNFRHFESLLLHEPWTAELRGPGPFKLAAANCAAGIRPGAKRHQKQPPRKKIVMAPWVDELLEVQRKTVAGKTYIKGSYFLLENEAPKNTWWFQFSSLYIYSISKSMRINHNHCIHRKCFCWVNHLWLYTDSKN